MSCSYNKKNTSKCQAYEECTDICTRLNNNGHDLSMSLHQNTALKKEIVLMLATSNSEGSVKE